MRSRENPVERSLYVLIAFTDDSTLFLYDYYLLQYLLFVGCKESLYDI